MVAEALRMFLNLVRADLDWLAASKAPALMMSHEATGQIRFSICEPTALAAGQFSWFSPTLARTDRFAKVTH